MKCVALVRPCAPQRMNLLARLAIWMSFSADTLEPLNLSWREWRPQHREDQMKGYDVRFNGEGYYCNECGERASWDEEIDLPYCPECRDQEEEEDEAASEAR